MTQTTTATPKRPLNPRLEELVEKIKSTYTLPEGSLLLLLNLTLPRTGQSEGTAREILKDGLAKKASRKIPVDLWTELTVLLLARLEDNHANATLSSSARTMQPIDLNCLPKDNSKRLEYIGKVYDYGPSPSDGKSKAEAFIDALIPDKSKHDKRTPAERQHLRYSSVLTLLERSPAREQLESLIMTHHQRISASTSILAAHLGVLLPPELLDEIKKIVARQIEIL